MLLVIDLKKFNLETSSSQIKDIVDQREIKNSEFSSKSKRDSKTIITC